MTRKLIGIVVEEERGYVPMIGYETENSDPLTNSFKIIARVHQLEVLSEALDVLRYENSISEKLLTPVKIDDCTNAGVMCINLIRKLQK